MHVYVIQRCKNENFYVYESLSIHICIYIEIGEDSYTQKFPFFYNVE